jgi:hypothetical protein
VVENGAECLGPDEMEGKGNTAVVGKEKKTNRLITAFAFALFSVVFLSSSEKSSDQSLML